MCLGAKTATPPQTTPVPPLTIPPPPVPPPPPPVVTDPADKSTKENANTSSNVQANRTGTNALRIDLNVPASSGGNGVNIPN